MNKWFIIAMTSIVVIIAIILVLVLPQKNDNDDNVPPLEDNFTEVGTLTALDISLNIGQQYVLEPDISSDYLYRIGVDADDEYVFIENNTLTALKAGFVRVNLKYFNENFDYISQKINLTISDTQIPFVYTMVREDMNKFLLNVEGGDGFDRDLFTLATEDISVSVTPIAGNSFKISIIQQANITLMYNSIEYYNVTLDLDYSLFDYCVLIGGVATSNFDLYVLENTELNEFNHLELVVNTTGLDTNLLSIESDLIVDGFTISGNLVGNYSVMLYYRGVLIDTLYLDVHPPSVTKFEVTEVADIMVGEAYALYVDIEPDYDFDITIWCESIDAVISDNTFIANKPGEYIVYVKVADIVKEILITVSDAIQDNIQFWLYDRLGVLVDDVYKLSVGNNYFTYVVENNNTIYATLNGEDFNIKSGLITINANIEGDYTLIIYSETNSIIKTYYFYYEN